MRTNTSKNKADVREWDKPKLQEEPHSGFLITEENEPSLKIL